MADSDSVPLLSQSHSDQRSETHNHYNDNVVTSLEDMIEQSIGRFGWAQFVQAILVALASIFDSQQSFLNVYTDTFPTWHCTTTTTSSSSTTCNSTTSNICQLSKAEWRWDGSSSESIISEWELECSTAFIRSLPASSHFTGCLLGILFVSTLADSSLGRKNLLLLSCLIMSFTSIITIFSNNIWIYSLFRFISGVARASIGTCTVVLLTEKMGRRWRGLTGVIDASFFVIGTLSLPAIAYISGGSSWRAMYLWTSIPSTVYCALLHFFVSESPRWLFMQGRVDEAMETLKRLSPNKEGIIKLSLDDELGVQTQYSTAHQETTWKNVFSSIADLFNKRWILKRTLSLMALGFGIGTVYYGMTFGNGNLGVLFNGLSEMPSVLMIFYLIKSLNRRSSMFLLCFASGICCIMTVAVSSEVEIVQFGLKIGSFFGSCTGLNVILIYAIELFPTCVRNSATSMARQAMNFGAIFSSIMVSAVGDKNEFVYNVVFGLIIICCGFSVVFLPETKNAALCDTMDEQERKENFVL